MKNNTSLEYADTPRVVLWTGAAIALGVIIHHVFFLVALVIALVTPLVWLVERLRQHQ